MAQLSKFGVPGGELPVLMPKLAYRFRVSFLGVGGAELPLVSTFTSQIVSCGRPNMQTQAVEVDVYNSKIYLAGKHTWQPLSITIRDDINNNVASLIAAQIGRQIDIAEQSAARAGANYKFGMLIQTLDGSQDDVTGVLDTWSINGCFITDVNYGEMNYTSNDAVQITLSIQYDSADYHIGNVVLANLPGQLGALGGGVALRGLNEGDTATNAF